MLTESRTDAGSRPGNWKVGTATDFLKEISAESLEKCRLAGIDCVELFLAGGRLGASVEGIVKKYAAAAGNIKESGLEMWSVHLPFGTAWDISATSGDARGRIVKKIFRLVEQAALWGAKVATIHASWEPVKPHERPVRLACAERSIGAIARKAGECNMRLAVECLPRTCLGNCSEELLQLTMSDNAFICLDTNHLLGESHRSFIRKAGHKIITLHASDNDGVDERHWIPGEGIINWDELVFELVEAGYGGPFLFEADRKYKGRVNTVDDLMRFWKNFCSKYGSVGRGM